MKVQNIIKYQNGYFLLNLVNSEEIKFDPGSIFTIEIDGIKRPYSVACSDFTGMLSFLIKKVEGGQLTEKLYNMKRGDELSVKLEGNFFLNNVDENSIFISTGTGVAPFLSYLSEQYFKPSVKPPKELIAGFKSEGDYCLDALSDVLLFRKINHKFYYSKSKDSKRIDFNHIDLSPENKYFICGNPTFVQDCQGFLINNGVTFDRISSEVFA